jgi:hypothetical protein
MGPFSARSSALPVVLSFLVALAACGDLPSPAACSGESACPVGAWCRSGQCVANAAPVAVIEPPVTAGTSRPLLFRGAASYDADPGDAIKAWSWKVSPPAGTTGCEPLPGTGSSADLTVVFPCAGDHDVSLSVRDSMGLESAVRTVRVRVDLTLDPPQLTAGPDVSVGHRCSGIPLSCTPWDGVSPELALSAIGDAPAGVTLTYRWSVEPPPELAQQPAPRVTFTPGDTAAEPRVLVETAGTAISGRYTFVVVATDSRGMVAVGRQRVDVGNRPPVLSGGGRVLLPHGYDTGTRRFIATGETPVAAWSDPDGDPVTPLGFTSTRSGDGGTVLDVQGLGDRARITVVVPYAKPSDAGYLIGPGVSRRVELVVADVNGARATAGWDVEVANRAPRLVAAIPSASVDHTYEAPFQRYTAQAALSSWVDDDGDPLLFSVQGDAACSDVVERQGTAWVTCSAPYAGRPDAGRLVGTHALSVSAADPFTAGPSQPTRLEIRNRPPRLIAARLGVAMDCVREGPTCCTDGIAKGTCFQYDYSFVQTSAVTPVVVDDDGDPLDLSLTGTGGCLTAAPPAQPCTGDACSPLLTMCGDRWACAAWSPTGALSVAAGDGVASVVGPVTVDGACRR